MQCGAEQAVADTGTQDAAAAAAAATDDVWAAAEARTSSYPLSFSLCVWLCLSLILHTSSSSHRPQLGDVAARMAVAARRLHAALHTADSDAFAALGAGVEGVAPAELVLDEMVAAVRAGTARNAAAIARLRVRSRTSLFTSHSTTTNSFHDCRIFSHRAWY
jgi:hypothetical protein